MCKFVNDIIFETSVVIVSMKKVKSDSYSKIKVLIAIILNGKTKRHENEKDVTPLNPIFSF